MKNIHVLASGFLFVAACKDAPQQNASNPAANKPPSVNQAQPPADHPGPQPAQAGVPGHAASQPASAASGPSGKVIETMSSGGYTYVHVDYGSKKIWAAAPEFKVEVGATVTVPQGAPMSNYTSKTLNRTFDLVYFVPSVTLAGAAAGGAGAEAKTPSMPPVGKGPGTPPAKAPEVDLSGIKKAGGGHTVAELFAKKTELAGKEVKVRAKVVKFNAGIMGTNWAHLRDGTGSAGTNDLTVTTDAAVKVGNTVVVSGAITLDKDFGHGYKYDVIIEKAKVAVE